MKNGTIGGVMAQRRKVLVLDDDPVFLELCQELLGTLSGQPEIRTATNGGHALALLESEPYSLLMTDLRMPGMDGFQVLSIVQRRHPNLRTIVMTGMANEEYRSRAYATGIDLYIEKPKTPAEIKLFVDCVESLLEREEKGGFRGVQSKSLSDIVQMESLSQCSTVLKITNGPLVGKIWLLNGDLIDAEAGEHKGEEAFKQIMAWRSGTFESLPAEPERPRAIHNSVQGLLLDSAQMIDELQAGEVPGSGGAADGAGSPLARLAAANGLEFVVVAGKGRKCEHFACENPDLMAKWARQTVKQLSNLGEKLKAGTLQHVLALGPQRHVGLAQKDGAPDALCVGLKRGLSAGQALQTLKTAMVQWAS